MSAFLDDVNTISSLISQGKVILCPTDTIWGLSCDATNEKAVNKIYQIKCRDRNKPFILLVESIERLKRYVVNLHPRIEDLMAYYKKPLTIIHQASKHVPAHLMPDTNTLAVRLTHDPLLIELIKQTDKPLVSTSANIQSAPCPALFKDISGEILAAVDFTCFSRRTSKEVNPPSKIVRYTKEGELIFLRQ